MHYSPDGNLASAADVTLLLEVARVLLQLSRGLYLYTYDYIFMYLYIYVLIYSYTHKTIIHIILRVTGTFFIGNLPIRLENFRSQKRPHRYLHDLSIYRKATWLVIMIINQFLH